MPFYQDLIKKNQANKRTLNRLIDLRHQLKNEIKPKTEKHLLLATWNIRDFDKPSYNFRLDESFYYIAEIISHFDLVAIQEVYKDLTALNRVMKILGSEWDYVFSDTTEGSRGNSERMAYVYNSKKIRFGGLSGEMVIPPVVKTINGVKTKVPVGQVWRTPLICGFKSGWAKFMICSVHIQWGKSIANSQERIQEIEHVADFLRKRTNDKTAWARKIVLLGDFNIFSNKDQTYQALVKKGFKSPDVLDPVYTNLASKKRKYDQILLRERKNKFEVVDGGAFDFTQSVFKDGEENTYKSMMTKLKKDPTIPDTFYKNYKTWRTHQISDHLPLWVELKIDYSDEYLKYLLSKQ